MIAAALSFFCGAILASLCMRRHFVRLLKSRDRKIELLRWQVSVSGRLTELEAAIRTGTRHE